MKRVFPWMLAVGLVWVALGIYSMVREDYSQAGMNFSVGTVFMALAVRGKSFVNE